MEVLLIGVAVAISLLMFKLKFEAARWGDLTLDIFFFMLLSWLFHGSEIGAVIAVTASLCISVYLYFKPPKLPSVKNSNPKE